MKQILVVDIETTGFLNKGGSIVEIGIVSLDIDTGKRKVIFDSVCREKWIDDNHFKEPHLGWIFKNSDLTIAQVKAAPTLEELKPELTELLSCSEGVAAYNCKFDFDFLNSRKIPIPHPLPCPMLALTNIIKLPSTHPYYRKRGQFKWPSVEEAWRFLFSNKPYIEKHRGADDAMHEALIIHEAYMHGYYKIK